MVLFQVIFSLNVNVFQIEEEEKKWITVFELVESERK